MKVELSYEELKTIARKVSSYIAPLDCELIAIPRGGLTFAHLVSYRLSKPLNFFLPKSKSLAFPIDPLKTLVFLEDVIAEGRTFDIVRETFPSHYFATSVVDKSWYEKFPQYRKYLIPGGLITNDWIVFPYEEPSLVEEGDRGLFRESTSMNSHF